ncbi:helix-turn-helix domain-containing protein [Streptomyces sp. NPDC007172]|uniref:helix-turn-helix domain-containing protein n=1 Tax=unclassified Streptomyces TaxID=2593676 RepID=UPI0036771590
MLTQPSFGRRLKQLRQQRGKTQSDLTGPGMSSAYLSRLESGARPPTERAVAILAERLGVPAGAFETTDPSGLVDVLAAVLVVGDESGHARRMLESALSGAEHVDVGLQWQAHAHLARLLTADGERSEARTTLTKLAALSDELGHAVLRVYSRLHLARVQRDLGEADSARITALEALRIGSEDSLDNDDMLRCRLLLASVTAELGDLAEASRISEEACARVGGQTGALAAQALWTAATVSTRRGNYELSASFLERAMSALSSRDDLLLWMRLRHAAAALALQALPPAPDKAQRYLDETRPALELIGTAQHQQECAFLHAQLAYVRGEYEEADRHCEQAATEKVRLNFRDRIRLEMLKAQIRVKQSDPTARARLYALAAEAQDRGMLDLTAEIWRAACLGDRQDSQ